MAERVSSIITYCLSLGGGFLLWLGDNPQVLVFLPAAGTFLVTTYYKHRANRREEIEHKARLLALKASKGDP